MTMKNRPAARRAALARFLCLLSFIPAAAQPVFSGLLDGKMSAFVSPSGMWSYALEEYANIRFSVRTGSAVRLNGAVNLLASSGSYTGLATSGELERLELSVRGDKADTTLGLMRLSFGFGTGFVPTDYLSLPNPLFPDARSRGVLGVLVSAYPSSTTRFRVWFVDREDLSLRAGLPAGTIDKRPNAGLSADWHGRKLSLQALYALDPPRSAGDPSVHRLGLSLKADLVASVMADALLTDPASSITPFPDFFPVQENLFAAIGADYSLVDGKLYLLAQYIYTGSGSLSALIPDLVPDLDTHHYAYGQFAWQFNDYTRISAGAAVSLVDASFLPAVDLSHDLFQGCTVLARVTAFIDKSVYSSGPAGVFGPEQSGMTSSQATAALISLGLRYRF